MAKKKSSAENKRGPASIKNRRAWHEYEIFDTYEGGIVLVGSEVKSIYLGRVNLVDAFCRIINGEIWLMNLDIEPYEHSTHFLPERRRDRKLLFHKKEIYTLDRKSQEKGYTIIPLALYFKNGKVKVEIGLARGKKQYEKREQIAQKETRREMERLRSRKLQ